MLFDAGLFLEKLVTGNPGGMSKVEELKAEALGLLLRLRGAFATLGQPKCFLCLFPARRETTHK